MVIQPGELDREAEHPEKLGSQVAEHQTDSAINFTTNEILFDNQSVRCDKCVVMSNFETVCHARRSKEHFFLRGLTSQPGVAPISASKPRGRGVRFVSSQRSGKVQQWPHTTGMLPDFERVARIGLGTCFLNRQPPSKRYHAGSNPAALAFSLPPVANILLGNALFGAAKKDAETWLEGNRFTELPHTRRGVAATAKGGDNEKGINLHALTEDVGQVRTFAGQGEIATRPTSKTTARSVKTGYEVAENSCQVPLPILMQAATGDAVAFHRASRREVCLGIKVSDSQGFTLLKNPSCANSRPMAALKPRQNRGLVVGTVPRRIRKLGQI